MSSTTKTDLHYWLWLHHAGATFHHRALAFLSQVQQLSDLQHWSERALLEAGFNKEHIRSILSPDWQIIQPTLRWLECSEDHHVIPYCDQRYPTLLKQIPDPPFVLYLKGQPDILNRPQIAMVGARKASPSACEMAFQWGQSLSRAGVTVTSGMALGIDGESHRGAIAAQSATIAVVGTSPDIDYPLKHRTLAQDIVAHGGAVVSEFWPTTQPMAGNFPRRNRIISGLSLGVLVVEAAMRSGSLITARMALEQNRDVFAIPGSAANPMARGTNYLIKQGAKLVDCIEDILEEYHFDNEVKKSFSETGQDTILCTHLGKEELKILHAIEDHLTGVELIVSRTGFSAQTVSSRLVELQFQGLIKAMPGGYVRLRRAQNERECA